MIQDGTSTGADAVPPLRMTLRVNLSVMMFLQFAIWGSWFVVFTPYLTGRGFSDAEAGILVGNVALGAIFSTLFAGYLADRFFSSERMMAVLHLAGSGLLYWMAQIQNPKDFWLLFTVSLTYALLYNPTLALSNSIAFSHIPDATRDFPGIRVLGTLGWIAAGFLIDFLFIQRVPLPGGGDQIVRASASNGPLLLAACLSAALGIYSFFLPHTPPSDKDSDAIPFLKALELFKDFSFAVFFIVSFVITIALAFYYTEAPNFLEKAIGVTHTGSTMLLGQVAELILLPILPLFLWRLGMKWVLVLGMFCWGLRYALFSLGGPQGWAFALVIAGVALHGFCFDFFFAAGFIHVDNEAPRDIRASAQALFGFLTYGVGMWLGSLLAGKLLDRFTNRLTTFDGKEYSASPDWVHYWQVPSVGILVMLALFVLFFQVRPRKQALEPREEWKTSEAPTDSDGCNTEQRGGIQPGNTSPDA
jgi:nucleoside transporter